MSKVTVEHLYKIYPGEKGKPDKIAVEDAHFEINDHEFMVLVGPSGCGKTTTLRMIAGLEDLSKGNIFIAGKCVNNIPPKDRDIAMVFQNYALYPHMTVYQNMAFGLKLRGFSQAEIDRRVRDAASVLGLTQPDNLLERKPKALSGGQRQRVALGRAIVRQPKAFLFDEPLSNLDAKMRVEMRAEISRLHRRLNSTMIYVTHDQTEAMTLADRIVVMKDGRIRQIAEPLTLYRQPADLFVAGFIGSPAMNFIPGTVVRDGDCLAFVEQTVNSSQREVVKIKLNREQSRKLSGSENQAVILGIRPEALDHTGSLETPAKLSATVETIELMGAETYLYLNTGHHRLTARSSQTQDKTAIGKQIILEFDANKIHVFDARTEVAIF